MSILIRERTIPVLLAGVLLYTISGCCSMVRKPCVPGFAKAVDSILGIPTQLIVEYDSTQLVTRSMVIAISLCDDSVSRFCAQGFPKVEDLLPGAALTVDFPMFAVPSYVVEFDTVCWDVVRAHDTLYFDNSDIHVSNDPALEDSLRRWKQTVLTNIPQAIREIRLKDFSSGDPYRNMLYVKDPFFAAISCNFDYFLFRLYWVRITYLKGVGKAMMLQWNIGHQFEECGAWVRVPVNVNAIVSIDQWEPFIPTSDQCVVVKGR